MPRNSRKFKRVNNKTNTTPTTPLGYIQGIQSFHILKHTTQPQNYHNSANTPSTENQNNLQHNKIKGETTASRKTTPNAPTNFIPAAHINHKQYH